MMLKGKDTLCLLRFSSYNVIVQAIELLVDDVIANLRSIQASDKNRCTVLRKKKKRRKKKKEIVAETIWIYYDFPGVIVFNFRFNYRSTDSLIARNRHDDKNR